MADTIIEVRTIGTRSTIVISCSIAFRARRIAAVSIDKVMRILATPALSR